MSRSCNKVLLSTGRVLIDLTSDTVTAGALLAGYTAHKSDGTVVTGTLSLDGTWGVYRGASLGTGSTFATASTSTQRASIANGSFDDLYIGDYWTINNVQYRIADFQYWLHSGDTECTTNHIVIVPDSSLASGAMNSTNIVTNAYIGSNMYTDNNSALATAKTIINNAFGGYLLSHRNYLPKNFGSDGTNAGQWKDSSVDLMNELMVYGGFIHSKSKWVDEGYINTIDRSQLALFRLNPAMINLRYTYWLRDVATTDAFSVVQSDGIAGFLNASSSAGIRPAIAIRGTTP